MGVIGLKIQNSIKQSLMSSKKSNIEGKERYGNIGPTFNSRLTKIGAQDYKNRLTFLLEEVNDQGKKLSKHVDIKELKRYKKLISEFLYETINYSHKFQKENILDRRGRHKVYAVITKVNNELEELTQEVLKEEKDNINILKKLDDIRGLLLDIII